jgi:glycosyltransferase involved in cell wall biosynthesis
MKILQLISSSGRYGAESMLVTLGRALNQAGHNCTVAAFDNSHAKDLGLATYASKEGLDTELIPCHGRMDWGTIRHIRRLLQRGRVDILHCHGYKADIYGFCAASSVSIPIISTCHNWIEHDLATRFYGMVDRFLLLRFDAVVAVSQPIAQRLLHSGVSPGKVAVIPNGIDVDSYAASSCSRVAEFAGEDKVVVAMVGRLAPEKGGEFLIRAARIVLESSAKVLFVLVGDGPERAKLQDLSSVLGISEHVLFVGERTDMPRVYAGIDILVLPSVAEGLPMTMLEGMAARKAIVATDVGDVSRVIGNTGFVVAPGDAAAIATKILYLIDHPEIRAKLGSTAQAIARNQYSNSLMLNRYEKLYINIVEAQPIQIIAKL